MKHGYRLKTIPRRLRLVFLVQILSVGLFGPAVQAEPPIGSFYYPPGNVPPGPPPNYNQIDSAYFAGEPSLPMPPPDSGGFYIWVDSAGTWNIANHIYSKGLSLEQFHGSILARMEYPPTPNVNIFAVNFEIFSDTMPAGCYLQNDRWGWYDWGNGLYEVWWDVSTRENRENNQDLNDFMIIKLVGCAIDFNVWSSGHDEPFGPDQIFLGANMIPLSEVPEFEDTYPGLDDPYQEQAGDDPEGDPNITIFTAREGNGASYNADGLITAGQTYPCGSIKGYNYGDYFGGTFVYEGDGIEFSSVCEGLEGPGLKIDDIEVTPLADSMTDALIDICGGTQIWSLLKEFTPWENVNIFGYYDDIGVGSNRMIRFVGSDASGYVDTTHINPGASAGLWLHNDTNGDEIFNGDDALLFSERALTIGSGNNDHQWFMVYDVSAYKGTGATYSFFCPTQDYTFTGEFDYLIFIDDDNASANFDHNDMMVGMLCWSAPEIVCPDDVEIECGNSVDPALTGFATATVACGDIPVIDYSDSQDGDIITLTWTASDDCGVISSCQQIITIVDTTSPEIVSCPGDIAIQCADNMPAPDISAVVVSDVCDAQPVVTHVGDVSDGLSCPETITRTYRVTDASGNYAECDQTITVMDNTAPEITCPADIVVDCAGSMEPEFTGAATAADNCAGDLEISYSDSRVDNVVTRSWTASDVCGNTSGCDQIITILDTTAPILSCPSDMTVQCVEDIPAANFELVEFSDDCDPAPQVVFAGDVSDGNSCPETITRTYGATDSFGNYAECAQTITVMDDIAPEIVCPGNLTINCSDPSGPENTGYPVVSDNCQAPLDIDFIDDATDELITRTWTVTDACGNYSDCVQLIAIAENLPPIVECPSEPLTVITLDLEDEICFNDIPYYDPDGEIASVEVNGITMSGSDICFMPQNWGPNEVTVVCTDLCGAQAQCSFTVIVGACVFFPGDANVDGVVNLADIVAMLSHLTYVTQLPDDGQCDCYPNVPEVPFYGGADANGSCRFNVADMVYLYDYLSGTGTQVTYCPLCPPTEGWLPPLRGGGGGPAPLLKSPASPSSGY